MAYTGTVNPIDLTLATGDLCLKAHCDVMETTLGSDHYAITINLNSTTTILEEQHINKFQMKKANWTEFNRKVDIVMNSLECDGN